MALAARTRELVTISFLALSAGFAAGWWLARQEPLTRTDSTRGAPHAVGPDEHLELGALALESGDMAGAERHFREALALDPRSPRARAELGAALMMQGRWEEARGELEAAQRLDPENAEAWFLTGILWRDGLADTARAHDAWERFLALVPEESPQAATVRGWLNDLGRAAPPTPQN